MTSARRVAWKVFGRWETLLVVLILLVGAWSTTLSPFFLTRLNLLDLMTPYIFLGLLAFGLTFVVVAGEIDISVCSTMAVSAVAVAEIWQHGTNIWIAAVLGLVVATMLGLVNGVLIGVLNLPSLAVTLGTLAAYRGLAYVVLESDARSGFPTDFTNIGGGYRFIDRELPNALLVLVGFALVLGLLLHATRFGRYLYAIGSNREAARYSGIPVTRVRVSVFALSGLMAGFAGIVYLGFFGSVQADAAAGSELIDVVTAVVLGGVNIFGGSGSIPGVLLALVLVTELRNGMQLDNLSGATQDMVIGGLLLGAILAGNLVRAAHGRSTPWRTALSLRKGVVRVKGVPVVAKSNTDQGG
jgi:rhamnose transport system permease protein